MATLKISYCLDHDDVLLAGKTCVDGRCVVVPLTTASLDHDGWHIHDREQVARQLDRWNGGFRIRYLELELERYSTDVLRRIPQV